MPLDRYDAVVIGAGVEGLSAAASLAASGRQTLCVDRRETLEELGRPGDAWISPAAARALGLFAHDLRLTQPRPQLALTGGDRLALWPDAQRSARGLYGGEADALLETAATLRRLQAALSEPGASARAMAASLDLVRSDAGTIHEQAQFLRSSAAQWLARRHDDETLRGLMLAMAAQTVPAAADDQASAPMLLALAQFFDDDPRAHRPVVGGAQGLITALARAFKAAGGELALGYEVSEILMEREAAAGVALGPGVAVKSPLVLAAVSPKRLAQGLLSTRRYGRLLSGLRAAPRKTQAAMRLHFAEPPNLPEARLGLWHGGVSVWLGASTQNLRDAALAMRRQQIHDTPPVEISFDPGLRSAWALSPYCPAELAEGAWTAARREALKTAMLETIRAQWPEAHRLIDAADLLRPREPEVLGGTGAIFGGADRLPDLDVLFGLGADAPGPLLKGVHLCVAQGLDSDVRTGTLAAQAALGQSPARARA